MSYAPISIVSLGVAVFAALSLPGHLQAQPANASSSAGPVVSADVKQVAARSGVSSPEIEYRVGSQDLMEIAVFGQPELTRTVRVNSRGQISLPLVGQLDAVGLSSQQLERLIADRLKEKYLQDPQVTVFIKEFTTLRFTIEGAVNKPGVYPLVGQMTLLRALAVGGGQGALSAVGEVMLFRVGANGERITQTFDVEQIRTGDALDPLIQNDDLVVVKRSKARVAFKDSLFRDVLDALNPIPFLLK
jgi:polysaccharide biosynthesis/export protein